mmetsp:Transcript_33348/g.60091  ORF Transcript_33348/g.60091 Transcript_33348/m.60091 type:complete len:96 (+) Transcript_33348:532-819(+)
MLLLKLDVLRPNALSRFDDVFTTELSLRTRLAWGTRLICADAKARMERTKRTDLTILCSVYFWKIVRAVGGCSKIMNDGGVVLFVNANERIVSIC